MLPADAAEESTKDLGKEAPVAKEDPAAKSTAAPAAASATKSTVEPAAKSTVEPAAKSTAAPAAASATKSTIEPAAKSTFEPAAKSTVEPAAQADVKQDIVINEVTFPDSAFKEYVRKSCDMDSNGTLSSAEIEAVDKISVRNSGITILEGIQYFTSLTTLKPGYLTYLYATNFAPASGVPVVNLPQLDVMLSPVYYDLTATDDDGGSVWPTKASVLSGDSHTFNFVPYTGYRLASVTLDGTPVDAAEIINNQLVLNNVTAAHSVHATFEKIPFKLGVTTDNNGTVTPESPTVLWGDSQTFTFTPNAGYRLASVTVDGTLTEVAGNQLVLNNITATHNIHATFEKTLFELVATASKGGVVTPENTTVFYGDSQTFSFTPDDGYYLAAVTVEEVLAQAAGSQFAQSGGAVASGSVGFVGDDLVIGNIASGYRVSATFKKLPPVPPAPPVPSAPVPPVTPGAPVPPVTPGAPVPPVAPAAPNVSLTVIPAAQTTAPATQDTTSAAVETPALETPKATNSLNEKAAPRTLEAPENIDNPSFGAESSLFNTHSHLLLIIVLLGVWLLGGAWIASERKKANQATTEG